MEESMKKTMLIAMLAMFLFGTLAITACQPKAEEVEVEEVEEIEEEEVELDEEIVEGEEVEAPAEEVQE